MAHDCMSHYDDEDLGTVCQSLASSGEPDHTLLHMHDQSGLASRVASRNRLIGLRYHCGLQPFSDFASAPFSRCAINQAEPPYCRAKMSKCTRHVGSHARVPFVGWRKVGEESKSTQGSREDGPYPRLLRISAWRFSHFRFQGSTHAEECKDWMRTAGNKRESLILVGTQGPSGQVPPWVQYGCLLINSLSSLRVAAFSKHEGKLRMR